MPKTLAIKMSDELHAQASAVAQLEGISLTELIRTSIEGYLDTNLVVPLGVDRTKVVFDFWFGEAVDVEASIDVSMRIQEEDRAICESVQRGVRSRSYHKGRLSVRREAGENLFHRLLAADLRA